MSFISTPSDNIVITQTRLESANADERAEHATEETTKLGIELEESKKETARVQKESAERQMELRDRIKHREDRGPLLNEAGLRIDRRITKFNGQRALLASCGAGVFNRERETAALMLWHELTYAHWQVTQVQIPCVGEGSAIYISSKADDRTRDAAKALAAAIREALAYTSGPYRTAGPGVHSLGDPGVPGEIAGPDTVVSKFSTDSTRHRVSLSFYN